MAMSAMLGCFPSAPPLIAGLIASLHGCRLHEGFANPCFVRGVDASDALSMMFLIFWLAIIAIPLGLVGLAGGAAWLAVECGRYVLARQREPSGPM